jgi:hypothetical protein
MAVGRNLVVEPPIREARQATLWDRRDTDRTPNSGGIPTAACLANTSICTWGKFATVTTTAMKASNPCF